MACFYAAIDELGKTSLISLFVDEASKDASFDHSMNCAGFRFGACPWDESSSY
jgi:hypothetical protein